MLLCLGFFGRTPWGPCGVRPSCAVVVGVVGVVAMVVVGAD